MAGPSVISGDCGSILGLRLFICLGLGSPQSPFLLKLLSGGEDWSFCRAEGRGLGLFSFLGFQVNFCC